MGRIRALYLEDVELEWERYRPVLEAAWNRNDSLRDLGDLDWNWVDTPDEAIDELNTHGGEYALFVSDLLFRRGGEHNRRELVPDGLTVVDHCARHFAHICIVAVSIAETKERYVGITNDFYEQKGDLFLRKELIDSAKNKSDMHEQIGRQIETIMRRKGWLPGSHTASTGAAVELKPDSDNLVLAAQLEAVGEDVMKGLVGAVAPDCKSCTIGRVDPGMSGAFVFRLTVFSREGFSGSPRDLLFKVSRDGHASHREVELAPETGLFSVGTSPEPVIRDCVEVEGWYAIAYAFVGGAVTLHSWLTSQTRARKKIEKVLDLLAQQLVKMYATHEFRAGTTPATELYPPNTVLARVMVAVDDLWPLVERYVGKPGDKADRELLENFIRAAAAKERVNKPTDTLICMSHGDLHTRNVLVGEPEGRPYLIDFSDQSMMHWASDFARLTAHLLIQGLDCGVDGHEPRLVQPWRQAFNQWLSNKPVTTRTEGSNAAIWHSVTWIRDNLQEIWRQVIDYEVPIGDFHLALAMEFAQLATQVQIPAPKRAFALLAAHDILMERRPGNLADSKKE